jgi:hypothetical protein
MMQGSKVVYSEPVIRVPKGTWDKASISACAMIVPDK